VTGFELAEFLFNGAYSGLWPLIVLPGLAALVCDRAARRLPPTRADWRVAAALAGFPGLVMLTLCAMAILRSALHLHGGDLEHVIQFRVTPLIAAAWLGRAVLRSRKRGLGLRQLAALGRTPGPRLAAAGRAVGLCVRELPTDACECFVAGLHRPIVFVSAGAVARMTDPELRAALHHERAHASGSDPLMFAILGFLRHLAPGGGDRAMDAYLQARERFADGEAIKAAGPLDLASALLAVARAPAPRANAIGIAGHGTAAWRLDAILGTEALAVIPKAASRAVSASLAFNALLAVWPIPHIWAAFIFCY